MANHATESTKSIVEGLLALALRWLRVHLLKHGEGGECDLGLQQGSANFFSKEPESKYFRLVSQTVSAATIQSCNCRTKADGDM